MEVRKRYLEENKEKIKEHRKEYNNRPEVILRKKEYYIKNIIKN